MWEPGNSGQFQSNDITNDKIGSDLSVTGTVFTELARHVALMVNLLNLDYVFIGGLPDDLTERLGTQIRSETILKWPFPMEVKCAVIPASLGVRAVAYGAAGLCLQRFFSLPNLYEPSGNGPSIKETLSRIKDI
jgi:hypothetical protein